MNLTYRQAAKRVRRSVNTIKRWRRHGLVMGFDDRGRRVVDEAVLLAYWRARMAEWPVHQYRLRKQREGEGHG
jgi:hypothetical protein